MQRRPFKLRSGNLSRKSNRKSNGKARLLKDHLEAEKPMFMQVRKCKSAQLPRAHREKGVARPTTPALLDCLIFYALVEVCPIACGAITVIVPIPILMNPWCHAPGENGASWLSKGSVKNIRNTTGSGWGLEPVLLSIYLHYVR